MQIFWKFQHSSRSKQWCEGAPWGSQVSSLKGRRKAFFWDFLSFPSSFSLNFDQTSFPFWRVDSNDHQLTVTLRLQEKNWNEACVFVWFFLFCFSFLFCLVFCFVFCFFVFFVTGLCAEPSEFDRAERGKPGAWRAQRGPSWPPRQPSSRGARSGWAVARSGHRLSQGKPKWCPPSPTPLAHRCRLCHETH